MSGQVTTGLLLWLTAACAVLPGPYPEMGINGYIDPNTWRHSSPAEPAARLNPIFRGWATEVVEYVPADQSWSGNWNDPSKALGPTTGNTVDVVSLGELTQQEILQGILPGMITLAFGDVSAPAADGFIHNGNGYDFAVFENGMISQVTTGMGSLQGQLLAELAYVEVSSNGVDFVRFPAVSLTPARTGAYGTIDMRNVHNLAGKHPNGYGICAGTPFDLEELAGHPDVLSGKVDLQAIRCVRFVDVPGDGSFLDDAAQQVEPNTGPPWRNYPENHPIYDQWPTWGSGGFDLEAVGVLWEQQFDADVNLDGSVDHHDLASLASAWRSSFGQAQWNGRCDLARPRDHVVNMRDFAIFASQWQGVEQWRTLAWDE